MKERTKERKETEKVDIDIYRLPDENTSAAEAITRDCGKATRVNYDAFMLYFNQVMQQHGSIIPRVIAMTPARRKMVQGMVRKYGKPYINAYLAKAAVNPFLNGYNKYGFRATFEWLMSEKNFCRVMEGNYDQAPQDRRRDEAQTRAERQRQLARQAEEQEHRRMDAERDRARQHAATVEEIRRILGPRCTI